MNAPARIKRPRMRLRGDRLVSAALRELADIECWRQSPGLTWFELARRLGVTRQALATKPQIAEAYHVTKAELKKAHISSPEAIAKRSMEDRLHALQAEMAQMQVKLDRWIEKWVAVEAYCHAYAGNADAILDPFDKRGTTSP